MENPHFVLQKDDVTVMEKIAVRQASMIQDYWDITSIPLILVSQSQITKEIVPVGTVEFVQSVAKLHKINLPQNISYPSCLNGFLKRKLFLNNLGEVRFFNEMVINPTQKDDYFIKPRFEIKTFTGGKVSEVLHQLNHLDNDFPVWVSEPVKFISECRYYIINNKLVGYGRYDDNENEIEPDIALVNKAIQVMSENNAPSGYALDFGVLDNGETALVEANDGWALGYYKGTCSYLNYSTLLYHRWIELTNA